MLMKQTTQIELVTFDLDNTLWDVSQTIVRAEQSLRQWMQENTADALTVYTSDAIGDIRERVLEQHSDKRHDLSFLRTQVLYECMLASGLASKDAVNAASRAFDVFFVGRNEVVFYDGALEVLADLSQRYRLFALTNGNANIDRVGIGNYFEGAVSSADVGASKPDPKMFHTVLSRAGVGANQAVHIGDHLSDDILGANNAGMLSLWYNHNGEFTNDSDSVPSGEVHRLSQLPAIIADLMTSLNQG